MSRLAILAASSPADQTIWHNIGEVIVVGALAGVGISIAFSLMIRGFLVAGSASREGRTGVALANGVMAVVFAVVCIAAVVGAVVVMLQR